MATTQNNVWLKYAAIGILIFMAITTLMLISLPLIEKERIFSNIFVDSYKPRKVIIIEKSPVRLIFFGETTDSNTSSIIQLIQALDKIHFEPGYHLNPNIDISVNSKLIGDRNRKSGHSIQTQPQQQQEYRREYRRPREYE